MPNFLVIGAAKCATTSMAHYMGQHPDIFMTAYKEPRFFALEGSQVNFQGPGDTKGYEGAVTRLHDYQAMFSDADSAIAKGEASPIYLCHPQAPERIHHYIPEVKLIVFLRNPSQRAFSSFLHLRRDGREPFGSFCKALSEESSRIEQNYGWLWRYQELGFYAKHLRRFFQYFDRNQFQIYTYEDLQKDRTRVLRECFDFVGVDASFQPNGSDHVNVSYIPRLRVLHNLLTSASPIRRMGAQVLPMSIRKRIRKLNQTRPQLDAKTKTQLIELYRDDIIELEQLLQRDLSSWLK